jgi:hypothetical protein
VVADDGNCTMAIIIGTGIRPASPEQAVVLAFQGQGLQVGHVIVEIHDEDGCWRWRLAASAPFVEDNQVVQICGVMDEHGRWRPVAHSSHPMIERARGIVLEGGTGFWLVVVADQQGEADEELVEVALAWLEDAEARR